MIVMDNSMLHQSWSCSLYCNILCFFKKKYMLPNVKLMDQSHVHAKQNWIGSRHMIIWQKNTEREIQVYHTIQFWISKLWYGILFCSGSWYFGRSLYIASLQFPTSFLTKGLYTLLCQSILHEVILSPDCSFFLLRYVPKYYFEEWQDKTFIHNHMFV